MTEFVASNRPFGDLILEEKFDYCGTVWRSYLVVPQEHLEDLFRSHDRIRPLDAYERDRPFWNKISERTCDFYKSYLQSQRISPIGAVRRQWFQWKDFARLEAAYSDFKRRTNQPLRLSVIARDPAI